MVLRRADPLRVAFSCAVAFLSTAAGGEIYTAVHGCRALTASEFPSVLLPIGLGVAVVSAVPAFLIEAYLVAATGKDRALALREVLVRTFPRNVAYAAVGLLTAVLWSDSYDALAAIVLLGPVIVTRWATVQYLEQHAAHDAIIRTLVQAVEIKDLYTRGHSERVAKLSGMIAAELRLPPERVEVLRYAATLHDVGKLGVPTRLLRKIGPLDAAEYDAIRLHPARGVEVVGEIAFLDEAYSAILHHHERMDGNGYPRGLRGAQIPKFARIIAVADAFDAMTSTRSYRQARAVPEALDELRACAGTQLDPTIVDAIVRALAKAAAAGRVWRGDGGAAEPGESPAGAVGLLPGAVVAAEFDHDDPAYQGPMRPPVQAAQVAQAAQAAQDADDDPEDDDCVSPSARRRARPASCEPVRSATESAVSANSSSDLHVVSTGREEPFDLVRTDYQTPGIRTMSVARDESDDLDGRDGPGGVDGSDDLDGLDGTAAAALPPGLSLPAQTGHDLDVLDPADAAAEPREAR
jgi:hypothetical protein